MARFAAKTALAGTEPFVTAGVAIHENTPPITHVSGRREDPAYLERAARGLGVALPAEPNTVATAGQVRVVWIAPEQWLAIGSSAEGVDVSDTYCALHVNGVQATDLLSKSVPIELSRTAFPAGRCARTLMGSIPVVLLRDADGFLVLVDRALAHAAWCWLTDGAAALTS